MELFRDCLRIDGLDVRACVLDDLSRYYHFPPEECRSRCLHWEELSVNEWRSADRSTPEGLQDFYNSIESWSFDLLWYAYLQSCGFGFPSSVVAARWALQKCPGGNHLDFGSGVGVTGQLFGRLGFTSTGADVSRPLLEFARWRVQRHGDSATFLDLTSQTLPSAHFDIVTATDSLVHVPDFDATARQLHQAIKPGGWLMTNFDVRPKGADESAWHLYDNALDLEYRLRRAGFVRRAKLGGIMLCYERVEPNGAIHQIRTIRDKAVLKGPASNLIAMRDRIRWPTPRRFARLAKRVASKATGRNR